MGVFHIFKMCKWYQIAQSVSIYFVLFSFIAASQLMSQKLKTYKASTSKVHFIAYQIVQGYWKITQRGHKIF